MSVFESRGQLSGAMKDLLIRWQDTKFNWSDAVSRAFEKEFIEPLETELRSAGSAMDQLSVVLQQVRRECQ